MIHRNVSNTFSISDPIVSRIQPNLATRQATCTGKHVNTRIFFKVFFLDNLHLTTAHSVGISRLAFPNRNYVPSFLTENLLISPVSRNILCKFIVPVFRIRFWFPFSAPYSTGMSMPEASIHKDYSHMLFKTISGLPGKFF